MYQSKYAVHVSKFAQVFQSAISRFGQSKLWTHADEIDRRREIELAEGNVAITLCVTPINQSADDGIDWMTGAWGAVADLVMAMEETIGEQGILGSQLYKPSAPE